MANSEGERSGNRNGRRRSPITPPDDFKHQNIDLKDIETLTDFAENYPQLGLYETWRYRIKNRYINGLQDSGALVKKDDRWWVIKPRLIPWWLGEVA